MPAQVVLPQSINPIMASVAGWLIGVSLPASSLRTCLCFSSKAMFRCTLTDPNMQELCACAGGAAAEHQPHSGLGGGLAFRHLTAPLKLMNLSVLQLTSYVPVHTD